MALTDWPSHVVEALFKSNESAYSGSAAWARFSVIAGAGICFCSDFSGVGGPEHALRYVLDRVCINHSHTPRPNICG
eukprot:1821746-Alexandrium_andersonii.AAC.1